MPAEAHRARRASRDERGAQGRDTGRRALHALHWLHHQGNKERPVALLAQEHALARRAAPDKPSRRHHELHNVRDGAADARLRPQAHHGRHLRAPRLRGRAARASRRRDADAHLRGPRHSRREDARRPRGSYGRQARLDTRGYERAHPRNRELQPARHTPHLAALRAAHRRFVTL